MHGPELGKLLKGTEARDAIHVAIAPVQAAEAMLPGRHVALKDGKAVKDGTMVGIVDPFLTAAVKPGEWFWLCLYQNTVTGMRHEWAHPAFSEETKEVSASEQWLRYYAEQMGLSYSRLLEGAEDYVASMQKSGWGEYIIDGGRYEGASVPDEFWTHYENVTGKKVADEHRGSFFSCFC